MSDSIDANVSAALALQNQAVQQQANFLLLRKAFTNQANTVTSLVEGATAQMQPQLATGGNVGTRINTTA
jgi:hypothetical protein